MHTPPTSSVKTDSCAQIEVRVVVFTLRHNRLEVLLTAGEAQFFPGQWELPGSAVAPQCSLEDTAGQCLTRYTGLSQSYLEQLYTYGDPARHPAGRIISVVYFALIPANTAPAPQLDRQASEWFAVDHLPLLAIDHGEILQYALRRLRYKLEYSAVGFELLPENFSLSELQQTYEIILGEKLDKRNFRRRILDAGIIESTPHVRAGEGRPARLYQYRPDAVAEVKARRLFP